MIDKKVAYGKILIWQHNELVSPLNEKSPFQVNSYMFIKVDQNHNDPGGCNPSEVMALLGDSHEGR